jgi:nucleotide-binding universal stress UspA family protein
MTASIKSILVPIDFSETSQRALDYAIDLATTFGATVTLVHAFEIPIYGFPDGILVAPADAAARLAQAAQAGLTAALEARSDRGVKLDAVLRDGRPWDEINAVAEERNIDLIVVGTHGRHGLARALLGSVAEKVIRTALRPVLLIHGPRDDK